jgi:xylulokinase
MARAVYEGTSYALRDAASVIKAEGIRVNEVKIVGGGANSAVWTRTIADVFDCPVLPLPHADSSVGGGLYALVGLGEFAAFDQVPEDVLSPAPPRVVLPDDRHRAFFKEQMERYRFAQEHVAAISHFGTAHPET